MAYAGAPPQRLLRALQECTQPFGSTLEGSPLQALQARQPELHNKSKLCHCPLHDFEQMLLWSSVWVLFAVDRVVGKAQEYLPTPDLVYQAVIDRASTEPVKYAPALYTCSSSSFVERSDL